MVAKGRILIGAPPTLVHLLHCTFLFVLFFTLAHEAGFVARNEQGGPDRTRPGDVLITRLDANGPCAVDITVRHTLAPSHSLRTRDSLVGWWERQEEDKRAKYAATCRSLGWSFTPFVMDCFGALGQVLNE